MTGPDADSTRNRVPLMKMLLRIFSTASADCKAQSVSAISAKAVTPRTLSAWKVMVANVADTVSSMSILSITLQSPWHQCKVREVSCGGSHPKQLSRSRITCSSVTCSIQTGGPLSLRNPFSCFLLTVIPVATLRCLRGVSEWPRIAPNVREEMGAEDMEASLGL